MKRQISVRILRAYIEYCPAATCALSHWDSELQARGHNGEKQPLDFTAPEYFLRKSIRHAKELLAKLNDNDDRVLLPVADSKLGNPWPIGQNDR